MRIQKQLSDSPSSFGSFRFMRSRSGGLIQVPVSSLERGFLLRSKDSGDSAVLRVRRVPAAESGKVAPLVTWSSIAAAVNKGLPRGFVPVLETGEDDGLPYYITKTHTGEPLQRYIDREGPLSTNEAITLVSDWVAVLDSQHLIPPERIALTTSSIWIARSVDESLLPRLGPGEYSFQGRQDAESKSVIACCALLGSLLTGEWWDEQSPYSVKRLAALPEIGSLVIPADGSPLGWKDWKRQLEGIANRSLGAPVRSVPRPHSWFDEMLESSQRGGEECNIIARAVQEAPEPDAFSESRMIRVVAAAVSVLLAAGFLSREGEPEVVENSRTVEAAEYSIQGLTLPLLTLPELKRQLPTTPALGNVGIKEAASSSMPPVNAASGVTVFEHFGEEFAAGGEIPDLRPSMESFPEKTALVAKAKRENAQDAPSVVREKAKKLLSSSAEGESAEKAISLLEEAASRNDAEARYLLGEAYLVGKVVGKDESRAAAELLKAAQQGSARAADLLGVCYMRGWGVKIDHENAVKFFRQAVDLGLASAHYNLGARFAQGQGVPKDPAKAASIFRKGAELGDSVSMMLFGRCYETGFGLDRNDSKARYWHRKSALAGNSEAAEWCRKNGVSLAAN